MVDLLSIMNERFSSLFSNAQEGPLTLARIGDVTVQHHQATDNIIFRSCRIERTPKACAIAEQFQVHIATSPRGTHFTAKLHAGSSSDDEFVAHLLKVRKASTCLKRSTQTSKQLELA